MRNDKPIYSKILAEQSKIKHGFFTRNGGVSSGEFGTLNCSFKSKDKNKNIFKNREIVCLYHDQKPSNLKTINQTHSNIALVIEDPSIDTSNTQADSLITKIPNIILGILTADCAPLLLYDYKSNIIAAIHVGRRGAKNRIIMKTINKMVTMGTNTSNILAAIGPCIGYNSYEVGEELLQEFISENSKFIKYFKKYTEKKYFFNLPDFIVSQLLEFKIVKNNITRSKYDTFKEDELFYSYRRSIKENTTNCGRMISTISMI